jgi:Arc/MetJ-type ribon-helix-helix transcriptional regulator
LKITSISLPEQYIECLDVLVELGYFPSRSEAMRQALNQFLSKEEMHKNEIIRPVFLELKTIQMNALIGSK